MLVNTTLGYFQVRYDSRVVIYERKMFIWLATGFMKSSLVCILLALPRFCVFVPMFKWMLFKCFVSFQSATDGRQFIQIFFSQLCLRWTKRERERDFVIYFINCVSRWKYGLKKQFKRRSGFNEEPALA